MPDMNTPNAKGKTFLDYIPLAMQKLGLTAPQQNEAYPYEQASRMLGHKAQETLDKLNSEPVIGKKQITEAIDTLKKYKKAKEVLENRIVEEERWWKLRHWDVIRGKPKDQEEAKRMAERPEPTSAWLFNSITNKHADIMDNFPEPNVLPRERADEGDADTLSAILPVIFERNNYEETYSDAGWYKLKHGVAAKGTFWNTQLEDGMGDIDIPFIVPAYSVIFLI